MLFAYWSRKFSFPLFSLLVFLSPLEIIKLPTTIQSTFTCPAGSLTRCRKKRQMKCFSHKRREKFVESFIGHNRKRFLIAQKDNGSSLLFILLPQVRVFEWEAYQVYKRNVFVGFTIFLKLTFIYLHSLLFQFYKNIYLLSAWSLLSRNDVLIRAVFLSSP